MSWSRSVSCLRVDAAVVVAALSGTACNATDLAVMGESVKLQQTEALPKRSSAFDGTTLRLRGVRGETLGVQIVFDRPRQRQVTLRLPDVAARVDAFRVGFSNVSEPSTAMYGESRGAGAYPDMLVPARMPLLAERSAFFDVKLSKSAKPGDYAGELTVSQRTLPVTLRIERTRIDVEADPLVWVFYLPKEIAGAHGLRDVDDAPLLELERVYHELFRKHGTYLAANIRPDRFPARREFVHGVRYWPVSVNLSSEASITADVKLWLEYFRDSPVTPFAIPIDEPKTLAARRRVREVSEVMARAGGGRPKLLRGVTDTVSKVYGDAIDVYLSPNNIPGARRARAASGERFWTYNGKPPQAGSMIIDTDGAALRTWGWIAFRYDVELWHAWEGLYFADRYNGGGRTEVTKDPVTFDERSKGGTDYGNGDGLLAYPGPVPSLRLKALRRGLQDRLLLLRLVECGGRAEADAIAARVIPRALGEARGAASWPSHEAGWEEARSSVLDALDQRCRDAA